MTVWTDSRRLVCAIAVMCGAWPLSAQEPTAIHAQTRTDLMARACIGAAQPAGILTFAAASWRPLAAARLDLTPWDINDRQPVPSWQQNASEAMAYDFVLATANRLPAASLAQAARRDLTFAHFFEEPEKYRGEIVHVEGTLRRVRRFDPDRLTRQEGVRDLYEGWVFNTPLYGTHPLCLVFTELPPGLAVGENVNVPVSFDGFFFKRYRYQAGDKWREAPLLIGHAPIVLPRPRTPVEEGVSSNTQLVVLFVAVLAVTLVLTLGLAWWYRRGDRRVRQRLAASVMAPFVDPNSSV